MTQIFLDSGSPYEMASWWPNVSGFTTNPTLACKAGITNYRDFAQAAIEAANGKPLSLEVLADDFDTMEEQAHTLASLADNLYIKIPITTTQGESTGHLCRKLGLSGVKLNVTAICTMDQIETAARSLIYAPSILSIFCGRIADTGRDPVPFITKALMVKSSKTQVLWASAREIYNYYQAQQASCDIITMTPALIKKLGVMRGMDLNDLSLATVKQFHEAGKGLSL